MGHSDVAAGNGKNNKLKDYLQLTKPSLNIMVVFSSVICYLLAPGVVEYNWMMILLLFIGVILGYFFNWLSAGLGAFSLFLYAFVYTPLKKVNAIAVLVGAFPGALPCLIGWAAGNDAIFENGNGWKDYGGWALFGIQFLWQFPHFWAIAWIAHGDYSRAGFKLLPAERGPTKFTAMQTIVYAMLLIPFTLVPYLIELTGSYSLIVVMLANLFLLWQCIRLYRQMDAKAARRVMFGSYIYLPVVLLAYLADKVG